jgi:hypothetical protein
VDWPLVLVVKVGWRRGPAYAAEETYSCDRDIRRTALRRHYYVKVGRAAVGKDFDVSIDF